MATPTSEQQPVYRIRKGEEKDIPIIYKFITDLAAHLKTTEQLLVGEKDILDNGFGDHKLISSLIVELVTDTEAIPVGHALYYYTFSSWKGKSLFLEDIYFMPEHRNKGLGTLLMKELAKVAVAENCNRMKWEASSKNESAIRLYERWGGRITENWYIFSMDKETVLAHASTK